KQKKVTFFIQGDQITPETGAFTKRAFDEGHQIASHTWDHKSLNSLAVEKIQQEMTVNDEAIKNVTGVTPNYMRPPFGDCNERCASTLAAMGYHVVQWNIDSNDWR
ncbi:MAG: chitin deacetylase, partial [Olpidium bornovanus]